MGTDHVIDIAGKPLAVYEAKPAGEPLWKAVVVISEAWGLNDDIRSIADRFASHGYLAVAPDIFDGGRFGCLVKAFRDLSRGSGDLVDQLRHLVAWVGAREDVLPGAVSAAGFCLGGGYALLLGTDGNLRCVSAAYADAPDSIERLCPTVASYGAKDRMFAKHHDRLRDGLEAAGISHDIKMYPDAGHSFMNDAEGHKVAKLLTRPLMAVGHHPESANDAWARVFRFFAEHL